MQSRKKSLRHHPVKIKHAKEKDLSTLADYDKLFPIESAPNTNNIRFNALVKAWQIRDFEIEMYWKRATYFWAFIASAFAAYIGLITSDGYDNNSDIKYLSIIIIYLGFLLSLAWVLVNKSSKKWQSNWEGHIDRLEDNFTGPLYKVVSQNSSHSVSKINQVVSEIVLAIWSFLLIKPLLDVIVSFSYIFSFPFNNILVLENFYIILSLLILIFFGVRLYHYTRTGLEDRRITYKIRRSK